jgi:ATP-dependent helicase/nuclease subunit B
LEFLKLRLTTKGELYSDSQKNVKSAENFELLTKFAEVKIQKTGEEILTGNIEVKPVKTPKSDACKYCVYGELCGFKSDKISNVENLDDNKILEQMKEEIQ